MTGSRGSMSDSHRLPDSVCGICVLDNDKDDNDAMYWKRKNTNKILVWLLAAAASNKSRKIRRAVMLD